MAIRFVKDGGAIDLSKKMAKGDKGDPGPQGERGPAGVYVGETEPTDDEVLVWFNSDGTATEGLATEAYVDEKVAGIEAPDLSGYAKKEDIPDVSGFALKTEIPEMPDLSGYALKTEIPAPPDLSGYALKTEIPDVSGFVTADAISGFQTEEQVNSLINTALGVIENGAY